jgi:hypothetical protein
MMTVILTLAFVDDRKALLEEVRLYGYECSVDSYRLLLRRTPRLDFSRIIHLKEGVHVVYLPQILLIEKSEEQKELFF